MAWLFRQVFLGKFPQYSQGCWPGWKIKADKDRLTREKHTNVFNKTLHNPECSEVNIPQNLGKGSLCSMERRQPSGNVIEGKI